MLSEKYRLKSCTWKVYLSTVKMYFQYFPHQRQMMWNAGGCGCTAHSQRCLIRDVSVYLKHVYIRYIRSLWHHTDPRAKKTVKKKKPELLACRHYFFSCWPKSTNEETKSGLCVFVAMHCILVYLTCMFLLNLSGFTPTIYVKKGGLDRPLCYFIAYHRYKNQTDTFSGLTPVLPWLRPTHLRATAVTTHPLKSPSAKKLFFPSSAATQKNVLWSSSQDSL